MGQPHPVAAVKAGNIYAQRLGTSTRVSEKRFLCHVEAVTHTELSNH